MFNELYLCLLSEREVVEVLKVHKEENIVGGLILMRF